MVYSPTTAAEHVYEGVRRMVMTGELQPGHRLIQRELSERFGTSNIPIIEATRQLERDGLVITLPNRGAQVPMWTEQDIEAAYLLREALEGVASRLFVQRASEEDKTELIGRAKHFDEMARKGDAAGWCEADVALHLHIVRASGARTLMRAVENSCAVTLTISNSHKLREQPGGVLVSEEGLHDELIAALLSGDPELAENVARAYVVTAREEIIGILHKQTPKRSKPRRAPGNSV